MSGKGGKAVNCGGELGGREGGKFQGGKTYLGRILRINIKIKHQHGLGESWFVMNPKTSKSMNLNCHKLLKQNM